MNADPERSPSQTEAQRLNAGVYRWGVRALVAFLLTAALIPVLLTFPPGATDVVVTMGMVFVISMMTVALSYNIRKLRLIRRIGKQAYLEQERGDEPQRPISRRRRILYLGAFGFLLVLELIAQVGRIAAIRH